MRHDAADSLTVLEEIIAREKIECFYERKGRFVGAYTPRHYDDLAGKLDALNRDASGEAYMLADKIVVYDRGSVLQVGSREDVFRRPVSARVARLTGATNVFAAEVVDGSAAPGGEEGAAGPGDVPAPRLVEVVAPPLRLLARQPGTPLPRQVDVCVRPEAISVRERRTDERLRPIQRPLPM